MSCQWREVTGRPNDSPRGRRGQTTIGAITTKLQNLIPIVIGIACVGLLPNARPVAAQSRQADAQVRTEQADTPAIYDP